MVSMITRLVYLPAWASLPAWHSSPAGSHFDWLVLCAVGVCVRPLSTHGRRYATTWSTCLTISNLTSVSSYPSGISNQLEYIFLHARTICKRALVLKMLYRCLPQLAPPLSINHLAHFRQACLFPTHDDLFFLALTSSIFLFCPLPA